MEPIDPREGDDGEELEAEIMRTDRPFGAELLGTTAEEALAGESLDQGLAQERPEMPPTDEPSPCSTTASRTSRANSSRKARLRRTRSRRRKRRRSPFGTRRRAQPITTTLIRLTTPDQVSSRRNELAASDQVHARLSRSTNGRSRTRLMSSLVRSEAWSGRSMTRSRLPTNGGRNTRSPDSQRRGRGARDELGHPVDADEADREGASRRGEGRIHSADPSWTTVEDVRHKSCC